MAIPPLIDNQKPSRIHIPFSAAIHGNLISKPSHDPIFTHTIPSTGHVLALKTRSPGWMHRSEGAMMHHAATKGVRAPKVHAVYDILTHRPIVRVLVSDMVPGVPLDDVWDDLTDAQKEGVKEQLREQVACMRAVRKPYIGRVGREPTYNVYNRCTASLCGPFGDEEAFDEWCVARLHGKPLSRMKWRRRLARDRARQSSSSPEAKFVLTHGNLIPRNIMVQDGIVTGIVDWARSGFFPEYAEYAFAMVLYPEQRRWLPVLAEVLEPCSEEKIKFTRLVESLGPTVNPLLPSVHYCD